MKASGAGTGMGPRSRSGREIEVRGERVRLLPEGALYWPAESILAVADFHLGKAETFGRHGYALPGEAQWDDLERLVDASRREGARNLLFLGDLVHAREGVTDELAERFARRLGECFSSISLTAGNHDRGLVRRWPAAWAGIEIIDEWKRGPFVFRHEPPEELAKRVDAPFIWAGHVHPCVRLSGGADRLRLKAFVIRQNYGLLPAFSRLAGGWEITPDAWTTLYPLADGEVYEL